MERPVESELTPVDSELAVVDVEVDSDAIPLVSVLVPVDSDATVLLVVDKPVDSELIPVEVEVDRLPTAWSVANSWLPLTASVLVALS
ncbi:hypothetical protein WJ09_03000 [Burkholderia vietnamiensis]|nr:hypothetical protein WJ09_03000 [Burkholderia vietnamiensis]